MSNNFYRKHISTFAELKEFNSSVADELYKNISNSINTVDDYEYIIYDSPASYAYYFLHDKLLNDAYDLYEDFLPINVNAFLECINWNKVGDLIEYHPVDNKHVFIASNGEAIELIDTELQAYR